MDQPLVSQTWRALLSWYRASARSLPWRATRDPYAVLVSELMLQQTQVSRVLPKYAEFLERFPTFAALAAASRAEVIRRWAPLGYNRRALRLHALARQAVERGGRLPENVCELARLDGVGRYTAAAVACFAFGQAVPVLDTNVRRVLARVFLGVIDTRAPAERALWKLAEEVLPAHAAYEWNQALMDLGATVCTARGPACDRCPLEDLCHARPQLRDEGRGVGLLRERAPRYAVQRREPSRRALRGRLVHLLRGLPDGATLPLDEAARRVDPSRDGPAWLRPIAEALAAEGLIELLIPPSADGRSSALLLRLPVEEAPPRTPAELPPGAVERPPLAR